VHLADDLPPL